MIAVEEIYRLTAANRLVIVDVLRGLDDTEWNAATLCRGWTVHHMAAHFVQPMLVGFGRFFVTSLRFRGDTDRTIDHITRRIARRSRSELIELLHAHADDRVDPPRVGPMGPFAETCVHLRDIARALGLDADVPIDHWRILLDYLTAPTAAAALIRPGTVDGIRLTATDTDWNSGRGSLLTGPIEAIGMAITGRSAALVDLHGPGADILVGRLQARRSAAHDGRGPRRPALGERRR